VLLIRGAQLPASPINTWTRLATNSKEAQQQFSNFKLQTSSTRFSPLQTSVPTHPQRLKALILLLAIMTSPKRKSLANTFESLEITSISTSHRNLSMTLRMLYQKASHTGQLEVESSSSKLHDQDGPAPRSLFRFGRPRCIFRTNAGVL